ncbi:hypothetical protein [Umezawaea beigongshangensis]|uniref:hypothetical protein n=1 Tax=Umezawaea beigongshangensis TaxID=2780383 RepID=UPI0018F15238|nr:hypothetical protein [Umezawaea beigongshangensis]
MTARAVAIVVGLAFVLAGLVIVVVQLSTEAPTGITISCGNGLGAGFDEEAVRASNPAYAEVCDRLRARRLVWAVPVAGFGAVLLLGGVLVRGRRSEP